MHTMHSLHTCCAPFSQRPSLTKHELKDNTVRSFKMAAAGHSTERQACCEREPGGRAAAQGDGTDHTVLALIDNVAVYKAHSHPLRPLTTGTGVPAGAARH